MDEKEISMRQEKNERKKELDRQREMIVLILETWPDTLSYTLSSFANSSAWLSTFSTDSFCMSGG